MRLQGTPKTVALRLVVRQNKNMHISPKRVIELTACTIFTTLSILAQIGCATAGDRVINSTDAPIILSGVEYWGRKVAEVISPHGVRTFGNGRHSLISLEAIDCKGSEFGAFKRKHLPKPTDEFTSLRPLTYLITTNGIFPVPAVYHTNWSDHVLEIESLIRNQEVR